MSAEILTTIISAAAVAGSVLAGMWTMYTSLDNKVDRLGTSLRAEIAALRDHTDQRLDEHLRYHLERR